MNQVCKNFNVEYFDFPNIIIVELANFQLNFVTKIIMNEIII